MPDLVKIVTGGGIGDCLSALQLQDFVYSQNKVPVIYAAVRDEVFNALSFIADGKNKIEKLEEADFDRFLADDKYLKQTIKADTEEVYLHNPDILFNHPRSFDYKKYKTTPQNIKTHRCLLNKWNPEKLIYLPLLSNTDGYSYFQIGALAKEIAQRLPDFKVYVPILNNWANKPIPFVKIPDNIPPNIHFDHSPDLIENIKVAYKAHYIVAADNLFSHLGYNLGCRRLVLDSRFPCNKMSALWVVRWFEDINDHINIENFPQDIARLVQTNIEIEQTNLLPKNYILRNLNSDWKRDLLFKYS